MYITGYSTKVQHTTCPAVRKRYLYTGTVKRYTGTIPERYPVTREKYARYKKKYSTKYVHREVQHGTVEQGIRVDQTCIYIYIDKYDGVSRRFARTLGPRRQKNKMSFEQQREATVAPVQ